MKTITRQTFHNYPSIEIPVFHNETTLIIDCTEICPPVYDLKCIIKYRKGFIYTIDWEGLHQKPKETFTYKTKNNKKYVYKQDFYYKGKGTITEKELYFVIDC
jgi:hypothetical protein